MLRALIQAADAIDVDSTELNEEQVLARLLKEVKARMSKINC